MFFFLIFTFIIFCKYIFSFLTSESTVISLLKAKKLVLTDGKNLQDLEQMLALMIAYCFVLL